MKKILAAALSVLLLTSTAFAVPKTTLKDTTFDVANSADTTKRVHLDVSGVTAGQNRTLAIPDKSGTFALLDDVTGFTNPMTTLGDTIYGGSAGAATRLGGNTTTTNKFLMQVGDGVNSAAPAWTQPGFTDLSGTAAINQGGTGATTASQAVTNLGAVHLNGDTMTGALILNADPSTGLGAATKQYVDNTAAGYTKRVVSAAATTSNLAGTYVSGTSLTNNGTQVALTVDGYSVSNGDIIYLQAQTTSAQNGIYVVTDAGSVSTNWVLTRQTAYDSATDTFLAGIVVTVTNGTANGGNVYLQ